MQSEKEVLLLIQQCLVDQQEKRSVLDQFGQDNNLRCTIVYLCDVGMSGYLQEVQVALEVQLHPVQRNNSHKHRKRTYNRIL